MSLTLRVHAIDETGAPVAGAIVRRDKESAAVTDADGVAMLDGINTGFDAVTVSHSMPAEVQLVFSFDDGSCGVINRTVTLRRGAPLSGTVVTPDGTPLPKAMVEVWRAHGPMLFVQSEADGTWSVPAMQAGAFEVRAGADGYARGLAFSGTHDGRAEQRGVVVRVAFGARLSGRVRYSSGQPAAGVSVYTETQPGEDRSTTTDADGRFEIAGLGAGRQHVSVGRGRWSSGVVMPGDGGHHELDIELPDPDPASEPSQPHEPAPLPVSTASLTGRVVRDGAPVARFAIVLKGLAAYRWTSGPAMIHSADGRFTLPELREASCTVHVLALGSLWASTATVELEPGVTVDLGDIVLQPRLRITGTVCNVAGEPIALVRTSRSAVGYSMTTCSATLSTATSRPSATRTARSCSREFT
ncbi:MAG: carboxypeptidase regulatory-like domain-containing protein [Deltaproteobacteria bacterium]|nr:carboxypeptidase regulatory-like domain-containing protein [Deltaproteobacteria bacterium]